MMKELELKIRVEKLLGSDQITWYVCGTRLNNSLMCKYCVCTRYVCTRYQYGKKMAQAQIIQFAIQIPVT